MDAKLIKDDTPMWSKQQLKEYKQRRKITRDKLLQEARDFRPWDFGYILNFIDTTLADMEDYYSVGVKVMQVDESRLEIVRQIKEVRSKLAEYCEAEKTLAPDQQQKIEEFFTLLGKYFREWWD